MQQSLWTSSSLNQGERPNLFLRLPHRQTSGICDVKSLDLVLAPDVAVQGEVILGRLAVDPKLHKRVRALEVFVLAGLVADSLRRYRHRVPCVHRSNCSVVGGIMALWSPALILVVPVSGVRRGVDQGELPGDELFAYLLVRAGRVEIPVKVLVGLDAGDRCGCRDRI